MKTVIAIVTSIFAGGVGFVAGTDWQAAKNEDALSRNLFGIVHGCHITASIIAGPEEGFSEKCIGERLKEKGAEELLKE